MSRLTKIRSAMQAADIEALLLTDEINQHYAVGFPFTDGYVLITEKSAHILTDFRYKEDATLHADGAFLVLTPPSFYEAIADILHEERLTTIGYENKTLSCADLLRLEKSLSFTFLPINSLMDDLREIKDEEEIALISAAQKLTDEALSHLLLQMTPSMTEIDVSLELEFFMRKHGAEGVAFETIAVSGAASSLPHGKAQNRPLNRGFLTLDFGARLHGYCADMTRTLCVGRADSEMKRLYNTVLTAQTAALDCIRAGVLAKDIDAVARKIIEDAGYHGAFGHGLGHGVGMFIHEAPRLSPRAGDAKLKAGHVVTVEPGIYLEGKYGCRIEDMVAVKENGCQNFTSSKKELIELFV